VSDPKQNFDPDNPLYYAPQRASEQNDQPDPVIAAEQEEDNQAWSAPRTPFENVAHLRPLRAQDPQNQKLSDVFAEAVARAEQQQLEPRLVEVPSFAQSRQWIGILARFSIAVAASALVALAFVGSFPRAGTPVEDDASIAVQTLQRWRSTLFQASPHRAAPTLIVRDNNGYINEPLELGVSVDNPAPGMTVIVKWMPAGARLTAGRRANANEWRVPAQEISDTAIIPPAGFIGEMNLSAELLGAEAVTLVTAFVRLNWAATPSGSVPAATASTTAAPPAPVAPPEPQAVASPPPAAAEATPPPPVRAEPIRELSPNEVAGYVRRAQELLASGDLQAGRLLLMRAAEAHDARAAFLLAKTFDPTALRQFGAGDPVPDLTQARNWYQRAKDWGSPEAQRQLDALASYSPR
jgi:hypothetical protein